MQPRKESQGLTQWQHIDQIGPGVGGFRDGLRSGLGDENVWVV